ncbi:Pantothenate kinase 2 [Abeliophyllum distichum]|uniref:pantothenate kinase n=1 Tax=Abeliophyllum distichum TaxID=126358 RepID=A0ABD1U3F4_9LAMI
MRFQPIEGALVSTVVVAAAAVGGVGLRGLMVEFLELDESAAWTAEMRLTVVDLMARDKELTGRRRREEEEEEKMERGGIEEKLGEKELRQSVDEVSNLALDIGGSLIKMVYFSSNSGSSVDDQVHGSANGDSNHSVLSGRLHFEKFETRKIDDWIGYLSSKQFRQYGAQCNQAPASDKNIIKATGGGAFKFADLLKEKLGIILDKEDEMDCLVTGANFLLKAVHNEAFTYMDGQKEYVQIDQIDLYPYLLVNIGSGVSMIKVDSDSKFERVSGTSVGGGTFLGLGKLLTKCKSFDDLLELSHQGNNRVIDMLVGDIYGGMDYSKIGLTSTAIASSFGKAISKERELEDYRPEDMARSLLRMISNNIGQIAYLNALRFGLKRIFFGGFFIRGHAYTMDTISVAVNFWSKGDAKAMFLRHEGFLGALGAFMSYEKNDPADEASHQLVKQFPNSSYCIEDRVQSSDSTYASDNGCIECRLQVAK